MIYLFIAVAAVLLLAALLILAVRGRRNHPGLTTLRGWK